MGIVTDTEATAGRTQGPVTALLQLISDELAHARAKFSGENVTFAAMIEEVGEVATALFEEPRANLQKEAVQVAVMAMRLILDGDHTFDAWREAKGLDPIVSPAGRASFEMPRRRRSARIPKSEPTNTGQQSTPQRITPDMVDGEIASEEYHQFQGCALMICVITLHNGYTVTGEAGCVDPALASAEIGRLLAMGKARQKISALLDFRRSDEKHREATNRRIAREVLAASAAAQSDPLIKSMIAKGAG